MSRLEADTVSHLSIIDSAQRNVSHIWMENFCKSQKFFLGTGTEAGTKDFTGVHIVLEVVVSAALKPPSDIQKILAVMKFLYHCGAELIRDGAIYQKSRAFLYFSI